MNVLDFQLHLLISSSNSRLMLISMINMFVKINKELIFNIIFEDISNMCLIQPDYIPSLNSYAKHAFGHKIITGDRKRNIYYPCVQYLL